MYETTRLQLCTAHEVDVTSVLEYYQENKIHLMPYEPVRNESYYTLREQGIMLREDRERLDSGVALKLFIKLKNHNKVIGIVHFSQLIMGAFCSCFVGYNLHESYVGYGYMTEALTKGVQIMFDEYGLHRIEGNIMPRNKRSIQTVLNVGFHEEGLAQKYLKINGIWEDHIHYVILNELL
ncbi:MAG: GNAT family N-acetyltransferase [Clostridia bacterium]|nr:GNAT family N-acetyltransferase [Clostridia bacterium]